MRVMGQLVLGINAYHGDSAAALLEDGRFICGIEEERLNRIKHWAGFPRAAIQEVLRNGGARIQDLDAVAISRNPSAHLLEKALFAFRQRPSLEAIRSRLLNQMKVVGVEDQLNALGVGTFNGKVYNVEHHRTHLASAFLCSPFEAAACLTVDGFGDFLSSMSAIGRDRDLRVLDRVSFPHSLGIFYTAITQFLGFPKYGDEYKVMGLSSYGKPVYLNELRRLVRLGRHGAFEMDIDFFRHATDGVTMSWEDGEPFIGPLFSERLSELLGSPREPGSALTERHQDIACSLQTVYEEVFFHRLRWLQKKSGLRKLCLAGGCAMNSVANGKIFRETAFQDVFIQSAAGDAGTSLGAALYVWHSVLRKPRQFIMEHSCWGPEYPESSIVDALRMALPGFAGEASASGTRFGDFTVTRYGEEAALCAETARAISDGEIVGWYQGRSEWGPRALGNRSIVVDPRRAEMKDVLNARIKKREPFRPFAPSILEEATGDYFEESRPDPFMIKVYQVKPAKRSVIPAVTHVDGSGRLQTVSKAHNPRYWALIKAFERLSGVPVVLNTSFNENEPIVNTPTEALACFARTRMHRIVLGNWSVCRAED